MRPGHARTSLLLFAISILLLIILTIFESAFAAVPQTIERLITFAALVVPAAIGAVMGALSLLRKKGQTWLAIAGLTLNALFALFHLAIVLFAG